MTSKPPKKTETIEIRLSHEAKAAFVERCQREGLTVSETVRQFIDDRVCEQRPTVGRRLPSWRLCAAAAVGAALGVGASAPSLAHASQTSRVSFNQMDRNHDGVITYEEFRAR